ncbi:hypothetical protein HDU67_002226 [Dinochytrium kinnereticum]|nr:hypothetical protein HDU67_002226 [Dinochytrium kinnereticum]
MAGVVDGINPPLLGGIIGAVLFLGLIFVFIGYLYYRRSMGKGFFSSEKTKTGGAAKVKAAPQAPNLAELGIGVGLSDDGAGGRNGDEGEGEMIGLDELERAHSKGIRISNGVVYQVQPPASAFAAESSITLSRRSRISDPGVSAIEPSISPGRTQTVKQGLASMSNIDVSTDSRPPLTKGEEAGFPGSHNMFSSTSTGSTITSGLAPGLPSKLEKERIADMHYARLQQQQQQQQQQDVGASTPGGAGVSAHGATITVLEPPPPAYPPGQAGPLPEKSRLQGPTPPSASTPAPTPSVPIASVQPGSLGAVDRDVKVMGSNGFPVIQEAPAYQAPGGVSPAAGGDVKVMGGDGFPVVVAGEVDSGATSLGGAAGETTTGVQDEFICVRAYNAQLDDEMELGIGDRVLLRQSFPDGWGSGQNLRTGKEGVFPLSAIVAASLAEGSLKIISDAFPGKTRKRRKVKEELEEEEGEGSGGGGGGGAKRTVQNRAAQKAFRERKQGYIRDLETKSSLLETCQTQITQAEQRRMGLEAMLHDVMLANERRQRLTARRSSTSNVCSMTHPPLSTHGSRRMVEGGEEADDEEDGGEKSVCGRRRRRRRLCGCEVCCGVVVKREEEVGAMEGLRREIAMVVEENGRLRDQVGRMWAEVMLVAASAAPCSSSSSAAGVTSGSLSSSSSSSGGCSPSPLPMPFVRGGGGGGGEQGEEEDVSGLTGLAVAAACEDGRSQEQDCRGERGGY